MFASVLLDLALTQALLVLQVCLFSAVLRIRNAEKAIALSIFMDSEFVLISAGPSGMPPYPPPPVESPNEANSVHGM